MKVLLTVAYDGSSYYGWQIQKDFVTVQQKVEEALSALLKKKVEVRGASRTDTGVHAMAQGVVFNEEMTIPVKKLPYAINSFLSTVSATSAFLCYTIFKKPKTEVYHDKYRHSFRNCNSTSPA